MDQIPSGDNTPTWLVMVLSVATTVVGWRVWKPIGGWLAQRFEADQQAKALERGDLVARLTRDVESARADRARAVEENMQLRQELGEERELRMAFASDYAVLKREVELLTQAMAEDKLECQRAIRRLEREIGALRNAPRGQQPL